VFPLKYLIYFITGSILIASITVIAEKKSPKIAGILMSLPVITFLSLVFMAVSQGVGFAGKAALWNPIGAIADLVYMGFFAVGISIPGFLDTRRKMNYIHNSGNNEKIKEIFCGLITGFVAYFVSILILSKFSISSGWVSLIFLWIAAIISYRIYRLFPDMKIAPKKIVSLKAILFRGLFGGSAVAAIVILGDSAGYLWGGLFSSFPGTITPVIVLLHLKNGKEMSYSVIKSSPIGLSATGLYSCMVWLLYPSVGIITGTLVSYMAVMGFLSVIKRTVNF
jgi:hypothetical protein